MHLKAGQWWDVSEMCTNPKHFSHQLLRNWARAQVSFKLKLKLAETETRPEHKFLSSWNAVMIFSLPTCFQSSPTPTLPSRTKCWPVWSPNLPQITSSSSPLPPSDDPVFYHFYHFCYLLSFFNHYLSSSSSLPRPPSPSDDPVCYHEPPPQEISLSLPYISGQDNNSTKADIQKRTSQKVFTVKYQIMASCTRKPHSVHINMI